jgi:hypothetical protein
MIVKNKVEKPGGQPSQTLGSIGGHFTQSYGRAVFNQLTQDEIEASQSGLPAGHPLWSLSF